VTPAELAERIRAVIEAAGERASRVRVTDEGFEVELDLLPPLPRGLDLPSAERATLSDSGELDPLEQLSVEMDRRASGAPAEEPES
jgi:hypothetical protein